MDRLESQGVLVKPEDHGVTVLYISPSFTVPKVPHPTTDVEERFVTSFVGLSHYTRPPPSRSTSTDDVHIFLSRWTYIIKSDMSEQFFQLPLCKKSMPYTGVITPYKGVRVYARAAMGMPGSTEYLDELMFRVLGDLLHEGVVAKLADDLYTGGNTIEELYANWRRILATFQANNLRLSARKTVIAPKQTTVLGWVWTDGRLSVSPHKINPLTQAPPPKTVHGLRSWIGGYKHLKSCVSGYSSILSKLEEVVAGRQSKDSITWTPELLSEFSVAQAALKDVKSITVPRPSDQLIIASDGAVKIEASAPYFTWYAMERLYLVDSTL